MRRIVILLVRRLKRDRAWTLDPAMSTGALLAMLGSSLRKALRGRARRIGFRRARGVTLIGKHVTLRNKRYIRAGRNLIVEDYAEIQGLSRQGITFGDRVSIGRFAMIRPSGYYGGELGEGLSVGDHSNIGAYCYIGCAGFIRIGSNVMMSPRVSLYAENHNFAEVTRPMKEQGVTRAPIVIEDDCWIASHSVILAGVTIGRGSIIAAGSVVTRDVPPYSIVAGSPARVLRSRLEAPASASAPYSAPTSAANGTAPTTDAPIPSYAPVWPPESA
ncbi:MAG: acyltransferase [Ktedonobacterales bacterium]|nr:acyltransferase [Ktedonobacterales bacterium]